MKTLEKSELLKKVCAGLFFTVPVLSVIALLDNMFGFLRVFQFGGSRELISGIGSILVAAGILTKKRNLSMAGCIVMGVMSMLSPSGPPSLSASLLSLLRIAACVAAIICCKSDAKNIAVLGFVSAGLLILTSVLGYVNERNYWIEYAAFVPDGIYIPHPFTLNAIVKYAAYALLGFAFVGVPVRREAKANPNATSDKIEHLTRLKDLLDKGVLTPEEFEEKKKQILNQ